MKKRATKLFFTFLKIKASHAPDAGGESRACALAHSLRLIQYPQT
jgi:hypothetical protein